MPEVGCVLLYRTQIFAMECHFEFSIATRYRYLYKKQNGHHRDAHLPISHSAISQKLDCVKGNTLRSRSLYKCPR